MTDNDNKPQDQGQKKIKKPGVPASSRRVKVLVPREVPKGAHIHRRPKNGTEATISLPTHIRTWWVLAYVLAGPMIIAAIALGLVAGVVEHEVYRDEYGRWRESPGYFTWWPMVFFLALSALGTWLIHRAFNKDTKITITPEHITVGDYKFDRKYTGGLRLGYEVEQTVGDASPFQSNQLFFSGLRMSYGP